MKKVTSLLFFFIYLGNCFAVQTPDLKLTPGKTNPILTKEVICSPKFRTGVYRNVPDSEKKKVMAEYNLSWSDHAKYEFDHDVPLEDGGSNDIQNIWPQLWADAHVKDKLENFAHKCICQDKMDLADAQKRFMSNWYQFYLDTKEASVCP